MTNDSSDSPQRIRMIDLSCDLGEGSTDEEIEVELQLWPLVSSANIACGGHAGDQDSMERAAEFARRFGVIPGAHPSYPDREHFGRRSMSIEPKRLQSSIAYQIERLAAVFERAGLSLAHVKPHGALYNDAHNDRGLAETVVDAIYSVDARLRMVASPYSMLIVAARSKGIEVTEEAFADRRYRPDGSLLPRNEAGALLEDFGVAAAQALQLATLGTVVAAGGGVTSIPFRTICVHGDMPGAVGRVQRIRVTLEANGIRVGNGG